MNCDHDWTWTVDRRQDRIIGTKIIKDGWIRLRCNGCGEPRWMEDPWKGTSNG